VIELSKIRIDGCTQPRAELNQATVDEYAEAIKTGAQLPPVTLFYDGVNYWLADGFHRYFGAKAAGRTTIHEDITPGTLREAILYSLSANSKHGLRRSNADKRRAVQTLLDDAEWGAWSDNELARRCAVSVSFVGDVRKAHYSPTIVTNPQQRTCHDQARHDNDHEHGQRRQEIQAGRTREANRTTATARARIHPAGRRARPNQRPARRARTGFCRRTVGGRKGRGCWACRAAAGGSPGADAEAEGYDCGA
jgi:hypothetical protein